MAKHETQKLHSCITQEALRRALLKGSFFAFLGAFPMALAGSILSVEQLTTWGIFIFAAGFLLIAIGLIPYKKLCTLLKSPDVLSIEMEQEGIQLWYFMQNKLVFRLPITAIDTAYYIDNQDYYGIGIRIKPSINEKVHVYSASLNKRFRLKSTGTAPYDLFLPYFSKRAFLELSENLEESSSQCSYVARDSIPEPAQET